MAQDQLLAPIIHLTIQSGLFSLGHAKSLSWKTKLFIKRNLITEPYQEIAGGNPQVQAVKRKIIQPKSVKNGETSMTLNTSADIKSSTVVEDMSTNAPTTTPTSLVLNPPQKVITMKVNEKKKILRTIRHFRKFDL